jgi:Holliday junction resolvase RusA-like endonuclease
VRFTINGPPRTKKNHQRIIRVKGRPVIMQAKTADEWGKAAIAQLLKQNRPGLMRTIGVDRTKGVVTVGTGPIITPISLRALVYRDRNVGDLGNYLAAICDALERAGVVVNDRLIQSFDGSRLLIDRKNPRVEIELTPMDAP